MLRGCAVRDIVSRSGKPCQLTGFSGRSGEDGYRRLKAEELEVGPHVLRSISPWYGLPHFYLSIGRQEVRNYTAPAAETGLPRRKRQSCELGRCLGEVQSDCSNLIHGMAPSMFPKRPC